MTVRTCALRRLADQPDFRHLFQLALSDLLQQVLVSCARDVFPGKLAQRYSMAAPNPITPAMLGVPASNL